MNEYIYCTMLILLMCMNEMDFQKYFRRKLKGYNHHYFHIYYASTEQMKNKQINNIF